MSLMLLNVDKDESEINHTTMVVYHNILLSLKLMKFGVSIEAVRIKISLLVILIDVYSRCKVKGPAHIRYNTFPK